jgi:hypothetical protein
MNGMPLRAERSVGKGYKRLAALNASKAVSGWD